MPLIEKAYAKLNMQWSNLTGGWTTEALRSLTNMPITAYKMSDLTPGLEGEEIYRIVDNGNTRNHVMTANVHYNRDNDEARDLAGIVSGHAYTLLGSKLLTCDAGTGS